MGDQTLSVHPTTPELKTPKSVFLPSTGALFALKRAWGVGALLARCGSIAGGGVEVAQQRAGATVQVRNIRPGTKYKRYVTAVTGKGFTASQWRRRL